MTAPATYPFSALVGQDDLRLALLLNAVHPVVGGVLVRGEKGTAKSTAVRALAALLPPVEVVAGCRFHCDPGAPDPGCPDGPHGAAPSGNGEVATPSGRLTVAAPLVELPVGASEDRLVGALDLERALSEGVRAYQPGLLADAHRGVLYVDEVNLLPDHLVDLLLDAAAMGRAHVERDGVSVSHAASFLLVGTMNPEEGELRPQLLDRFGLTVEVRASRDVGTRVEVVRRRLAFEADAAGFVARWACAEADVAERIAAARERLPRVVVPDAELRRIAAVCASFDVDGMRADLVMARAAMAHAAWRGADAVAEEDVRVAARLALPHRRRRDPFDEPGIDEAALDDALRKAAAAHDEPDPDGPGGGAADGDADGDADGSAGGPAHPDRDTGAADAPDGTDPGPAGSRDPAGEASGAADGDLTGVDPAGPRSHRAGPDRDPDGDARDASGRGDGPSRAAPAPAAAFRARLIDVPGLGEGAPGRRSRARTDAGRVVRPTGAGPRRAADLHLLATLAAAAPHQRARRGAAAPPGTRRSAVASDPAPEHPAAKRRPAIDVRPRDLRGAHREGREGNLVLFVVDASGSMAARTRMAAVTGAVLSLLRDAYQRRDKVGLVTFRAGEAEVALPPTSSVPAAQARLARLRTGGRTPLADGLLRARRVLAVERLRDPRRRPLVVLLTDGRATVATRPGADPVADSLRAAALLAADGVATVVVDCESGPVRLGLARSVAAAAGAALVTVDELSADRVAGVVHAARAA
ncbi:VWA domain-containing protein [Pseudonocardia sp.]|uniref:VWA domain-containing protein n=1 Tax=Pseudonocardia sp. TaxID=60912 RepID=UPI003D10C764